MALKILVIDDDVPTLELLRETLHSMGAEVRCVNSPARAREIVFGEKYDGVVLDIVMPELNGIELTSAIRQSALNWKTPIVAVSGSHDQTTMHAAMAAGATFFLHKPFDRANLIKRLNGTRGAMLQEQRRFVRVPLAVGVVFTLGESSYHATTRDLSEGGLAFYTSASLRSGSRLTVSFRLPGRRESMRVNVRVVRVSEECLVGAQFEALPPGIRDAIREFIFEYLHRLGG